MEAHMLTLLDNPTFMLGLLVAFAAGALLMIVTLMAFDAFEARRTGQPKRPRALPTNSWGPGPHGHSARADLRSAPR